MRKKLALLYMGLLLFVASIGFAASFQGSGTLAGTYLSAVLAWSPLTYDWSDVILNVESPHYRFTLTNSGNGTAASLSAAPGDAAFRNFSGTCGSSLAAFTNCTTVVAFTPTVLGNYSTNLTASATGVNAAASRLYGTGINLAATDTFTRADGGLGANWTALAGGATLEIFSGKVRTPVASPGWSYYNATSFAANQYSQAVYTGADNSGYRGVCVRMGGTADGYCARSVNATTIQLARYNGGSLTGDPGGLFTVSDYLDQVVKISASGTNPVIVTLYINGAAQGSAWSDADAGRITEGAPGIYSTEHNIYLDSWEGGNL